MKTLLILVDGMRPDAIENLPRVKAFLNQSSYSMNATTVMPSVTLPCHMSLFHSVEPGRHGTTTNVYMPQVRPVKGLCEVLMECGKKCAFFYNWEEIRDLSRPNSLVFSYFCKGRVVGYDKANTIITDAAIDYLTKNETDFTFLYLGYTDMAGHQHGWMTDAYMEAIDNSWDNIERLVAALPEDYTVIVTADHGGHDRSHGSDMKEDMTIPVIIKGKDFAPNTVLDDVNIMDIAPTITAVLGIEPDSEWEGKSLL